MNDILTKIYDQHKELRQNPQILRQLPVIVSSQIVDLTKNNLLELGDTPEAQLVIEAIAIHNRFKKNKIAYSQIKDQIMINHPLWVKAEEFDLLSSSLFNYDLKVEASNISDQVVWKAIENLREKELKEFVEKNNTNLINLNNEFRQKYPQMSLFIKKLCLDQISFKILGKVNSQLSQLFSLVKFDKNHNMGISIPEGEVIFAYINMNKMDTPKTPRFGSVFDSYEVSNHKVLGIFHKNQKIQVPIQVDLKTILVDIEIWSGNVVCEE